MSNNPSGVEHSSPLGLRNPTTYIPPIASGVIQIKTLRFDYIELSSRYGIAIRTT